MGYWDNKGDAPTKVTWANPQVTPEAQRQSGGWYYNPSSGSVERWWSGGSSGAPAATGSILAANTGVSETPDYEGFLKGQEATRLAEQNRIKQEEGQILGEYTSAIQGQEALPSAYTRLSAEAGVPGLTQQLGALRGEVFKVKDLLNELEGDINSRTTGNLMTESQRRRLLASEETPLRTQLARLTEGQAETSGQLGEAYTQVGNQMTYLSAQQQKELQPVLAKMSMFGDRAAREMTGFSTSQETQLSLYLDQLTRNRALSDREWAEASQLARDERLYQQEKEKIRLNSEQAALQWGDIFSTDESGFQKFKSMLGIGGGTTAQITPTAANTGFQSTLDNIFGTLGNFNLPNVAGSSATLKNLF